MGKLILSLSSNFEDIKKNVIKHIEIKSDWENIVIVPDRFSLLTELAIFDEKNVESLFNVNVMPISSFANFLLERVGIFHESVSMFEQVFLTRRAMQKTKDKFVCLPKQVSPNLLQEISKTISQLKASKVQPEDLDVNNISEVLSGKFSDIKLIYAEYERLLGSRLDSGKLLDAFEENLDKMQYLKNVNLFFVGFDSFTNQVFQLIKKLKKQVPLIVVGGFYHFSQNNKKSFELDIFEKFSCFSKDKDFEIEYCQTTMKDQQLAAFENVFAYKQKQVRNNNFARLISFNQIEHEIDFVTREIASRIKSQGLRFSDFIIVSSNLEQDKEILENSLIKYNLNYFLDTQINLSNTSLSEFILIFLKLFISKFDKNTLKSFVSSFFVETDYKNRSNLNYIIEKYLTDQNKIEEFEGMLLEKDKHIFAENKALFDKLIKFKNQIYKASDIVGYINIIKQVVEEFCVEEKCELRSVQLEQEGNIKQGKIYLQLHNKLQEVLNSLESFLQDESLNITEFYQLLKVSFENKQVATVPISSDAVFVGDVSKSYFGKAKYFYLIGASASRLPQTLFDGGVLSDENLKEVSTSLNISPTVKVINKRNKFKLLNIFSYIEKSITVTYSFSNAEGKEDFASLFVEDLSNIFLQDNREKLQIEKATTLAIKLPEAKQKDLIMSFAVNEKTLKQFLLKSARGSLFEKKFVNSVYNVLKGKNKISQLELKLLQGDKTLPKLKKAKELFFKEGGTSASQLETYFRSPFLHFISYGLKLREIETAEISRLEIGNIMHFAAEKFIKITSTMSQEEAKAGLDEVLDKIFAQAKTDSSFYKFFLNSENKSAFNYLKIEARNMCEIILQHREKSKFVPKHLEKAFKYENYFEKSNLSITGKVDRIDEYKDNFIVLDYKTGNIELNAKSVYLGQKIQLLIYADIYQKQTGKVCSGVFYFPIKNAFEVKQDKKLQGFFEKDNEVIFSLDTSISFENPNSQVINANLKTNMKNIEKQIYEFKAGAGSEFLQEMISYAKQVCQLAVEQIEDGNIAQVEKSSEFLDGMFEDELYLKVKNQGNLSINEEVFKKVGEHDEN